MRNRLTKQAVDRLKVRPTRYTAWDPELAGFGCTVHTTGRKVFVARYRVRGTGTDRTMTLGRFGTLTADEARRQAQGILGAAALGRDPFGELREARAAVEKQATFRDLAERYKRDHHPKLKERTRYSECAAIDNQILPIIGDRRLAGLDVATLAKWHASMSKTPTHANRLLSLVGRMMNLAEAWGMREPGVNPARYVKRYPEKSRDRFLTEAEYRKLGEALRAVAVAEPKPGERPMNRLGLKAIELLALTGCRRGEILSLRWVDVDYTSGCLRLPDSKTGAAVRLLGTSALALLDSIPRQSEYVFPSPVKRACALEGLRKPWVAVVAAAQFSGVTIHTLRHSKASIAARLGLSESIIAELLGHARHGITNRYIGFERGPLAEWNESVEQRIAALLRGESGANVVDMKRERA